MELRDYLRILHKYWILIVASTLVGITVGAGLSIIATPKYEASTKIYVSVRSEGLAVGELAQGSTLARQSVATYAEIVTTTSVLEPVIKQLDLDTTSAALAQKVSASATSNQSLIQISVSDSDPEAAAAIANSAAESLTDLVENNLEAGSDEDSASLVSLTVVQPATVPANPVSPRTTLNLVLGAFIGMLVGISISILRSTLDNRIHSLQDIEKVTSAPLLGGITYDPESKTRPLIVHSDPRNPRAESFRTLRTNLQFLAVNETNSNRGRSFVISSAGPGEGKSVTTANLALALAETGARVVLIDGDLRLPKVADYMGIEGGTGLTNVLIGQAEIADVLQRWGRGQLYILPAGKVPPNPSELLGSQAMEQLLSTLIEHFDFVIIDSPPLLLVTDAAVLSKNTNGAILVAASGSTRKPSLESAIRNLTSAGGSLLGVVATMLPTKGPDSYSYGAYGAYGGYFQTQPEQLKSTKLNLDTSKFGKK